MTLAHFVLAFGIIFLVQLAPAFAPPNWALVAAFRLDGLPLLPLGFAAAAAATGGRVCLALGSGRAAKWLPGRQRRNVAAFSAWLSRHKRGQVALLIIYCAGPFPSNVLFIAVGSAGRGLTKLAVIFFLTRCVTDTFWAWVGSEAAVGLREVIVGELTSWPALLLQLVCLVLGAAFFVVPWERWLGPHIEA